LLKYNWLWLHVIELFAAVDTIKNLTWLGITPTSHQRKFIIFDKIGVRISELKVLATWSWKR